MILHPRFVRSFVAVMCGLVSALLSALPVQAGDAETAKTLEALGGKVVLKENFVTELTFTDCSKIGAGEIKAIGELARLKSLTLYGKAKGVNDMTVDSLTGLRELESLSTDGAELSDAGLARLAELKNLRKASFFHLSFRKEGFTGKGFEAWKALAKLERLTVAGMSMGDEGFAAISTISSLQELSTWHTFQTEAGNAMIAKLPNLSTLKIGQRLPRAGAQAPSLSDASIPVFAGIKTLEALKLGEGRFSYQALSALKGLPKLKSLLIYESDVSEADLEQLKTALPAVKIEFQPLTEEQRKKLEMYLK